MQANRLALTLVVTAVLGTRTVSAGVMLDFTAIDSLGAPNSLFDVVPLETGWSAYLLSARTDDGDLISAVDLELRGALHQRWGFDEDYGAALSTPTGQGRNGVDSHLLPALSSLVISSTVSEDLGPTPMTLSSGAQLGLGNSLRGAWGVPGNEQRTSLDLAYVVVPTGSIDQLDYAIDVATRTGVSNLRKGFAMPEPPPVFVQPPVIEVPPVIETPPFIETPPMIETPPITETAPIIETPLGAVPRPEGITDLVIELPSENILHLKEIGTSIIPTPVDNIQNNDAPYWLIRTSWSEASPCCSLITPTVIEIVTGELVFYEGLVDYDLTDVVTDDLISRDSLKWQSWNHGVVATTFGSVVRYSTFNSSGFYQLVPEPKAIVLAIATVGLWVRRRKAS